MPIPVAVRTRPIGNTWRKRVGERRLDGLVDEQRPLRPRTVSDQQVMWKLCDARLVATTPPPTRRRRTRSRSG